MKRWRATALAMLLCVLPGPASAHGYSAQLIILLTAWLYLIPGVLIWASFSVCHRVANSPDPVDNRAWCGRIILAAWLPYGLLWLAWLTQLSLGRGWFIVPVLVLIPAILELRRFGRFMAARYPPPRHTRPAPGPVPAGQVRCPACGISNRLDAARCLQCRQAIPPRSEPE